MALFRQTESSKESWFVSITGEPSGTPAEAESAPAWVESGRDAGVRAEWERGVCADQRKNYRHPPGEEHLG